MDAQLYLQEHSEELSRKYPSKYIAVADGEIIAVASNAVIAYKKAKELGKKGIAIFYIPTDEEQIILI